MPGMNPGQQNPISFKFNQAQQMPDGSLQNVDSTIQLKQLDQSPEVSQKVKQALEMV